MVLAAAAAPAPADLVLTGGAVYTLDAARSWAEAVAVRDGRITFVGTDADAAAWIGPSTRVVRLGGRMLLPSFQDAHVHPVSGGVELGQCNLNGLATRQAILDQVKACARQQADRSWLLGGGWALPAFPGGAPTRQELDAIVADKPALLYAADGHSSWANSRALALARIDATTPDPKDGRIERDPKTGLPTGTLRESASALVGAHAPKPDLEERLAGLARAAALFHRFGLTAVQEANAEPELLQAYVEAQRRGALPLRVVVSLATDPARGPEQVAELERSRAESAGPRLRVTGAKIFVDGVIEARTAAMLAPYADKPGDAGTPNLSPESLAALVTRLDAAGFSVHLHAIGDRAVRMGLDAFEAARRANGAHAWRHKLAHIQVIDAADAPRFRSLGVIADFQPLWAFADSYVRDLTWPALGSERSQRMYPIGELVRSGAPVAFGSDWSVSSPNPLEGIEVALTRRSPDDEPAAAEQPLLPEQAIALPEALAAYTIGAAYANGLEAETGSLEPGKAADLVVLSRNLFETPPAEISRVRVLLTLLAGEPVYRDEALAW